MSKNSEYQISVIVLNVLNDISINKVHFGGYLVEIIKLIIN